MVFKARLVARGFEENTQQLRSDCPTCSKESLRMVLGILASKSWSLQAIDIKSAFLQGYPISRELYLKPPPEANTTSLWKLIKTPYGLVDAGRQWFLRVQEEFAALGAVQCSLDQAVFIWPDPTGDGPCALLVAHVDDFLYGGNQYFHKNILPKIRSIFTVGVEESSNLTYLGIDVKQDTHNKAILLSTNSYTSCLREIDISSMGIDRQRPLTSTELTQLKTAAGQLNWAVNQSRPDCAFDSCIVSTSTRNCTINDIHRANKALRKARAQEVSLRYPALDLHSLHIVTFCDASLANLKDRGSQGGFITFLVDKDGAYCPLTWQSKRIRRVVNSSLAAECLSAVEASETSVALASSLKQLLCLSPSSAIPISVISDNRSLVDAVHTSTSVDSSRLQIDISILREMIQEGEIKQFRWIETKRQVANALTKAGAPVEYLLSILKGSLTYNSNSGEFITVQ
jgi:hypothetical protein